MLISPLKLSTTLSGIGILFGLNFLVDARAAPTNAAPPSLKQHIDERHLQFAQAPEAAANKSEVQIRPTFDCAKASSRVEKLICANPQLAKLDVELLENYRQAIALELDLNALKATQQAWIKLRNACIDAACVNTSYSNRLVELKSQISLAQNVQKSKSSTTESSTSSSDKNSLTSLQKEEQRAVQEYEEEMRKARSAQEQGRKSFAEQQVEEAERQRSFQEAYDAQMKAARDAYFAAEEKKVKEEADRQAQIIEEQRQADLERERVEKEQEQRRLEAAKREREQELERIAREAQIEKERQAALEQERIRRETLAKENAANAARLLKEAEESCSKEPINPDATISLCMRAIQLGTKEAFVLAALGSAYYEKKDYNTALEYADAAIQRDYQLGVAYRYRGAIFVRQGRLDNAISDLNEAIRLGIRHPNVYLNRAEALAGKKMFDEARLDCDEALELDQKSVRAYNTRGVIFSTLGDHEKALADFNQALRLKAGDELILKNRQLAIDALEKAKQLAEIALRRKAEIDRLKTQIKDGKLEGYGLIKLDGVDKPICYLIGKEGSSSLSFIGLGKSVDARKLFIETLNRETDDDFQRSIKSAVGFDSLEKMSAKVKDNDCSGAFGSSADLRLLIPKLDELKIAYELQMTWFKQAELEARPRGIFEAEKKAIEDQKKATREKIAHLSRNADRLNMVTMPNRSFRTSYGSNASFVSCNDRTIVNTARTMFGHVIEKYFDLLPDEKSIFCLARLDFSTNGITIYFTPDESRLQDIYSSPNASPEAINGTFIEAMMMNFKVQSYTAFTIQAFMNGDKAKPTKCFLLDVGSLLDGSCKR